MHIHVLVHVHVCMCACTCMYVCMYMYVCVHVHVCMCACTCMYVCLYMYMYMYVYMGTHGMLVCVVYCIVFSQIILLQTCFLYRVMLKNTQVTVQDQLS